MYVGYNSCYHHHHLLLPISTFDKVHLFVGFFTKVSSYGIISTFNTIDLFVGFYLLS